MVIRAVVFDIGGVLEYTPDTGWRERWDARYPMTVREIGAAIRAKGMDGGLGNCTEQEWLGCLRDVSGMNAQQMGEFMHDLWEEYLGTLNVELADYCRQLHGKYITAIISNSFVGAREREGVLYHFDEMTDLIIYSHEVGLEKPDRRIFELACERLGVQPSEMIFVDDHEDVMTAAREMGIHCILFQDNAQTIRDIEACLQTSD